MLRWPFVLSMLVLEAAAAAQERDLTKEPALYVVGYAHLDTQWRWEYPQTISEFLPKTMHDNFALFAKYPHSGRFTDYHYHGTGDVGGAPSESSVALLESIVKKNDGPLQVIEATAEQMFLDIREDQASRLPRYRGDLELTIYACGEAVITLHASSFTLQPDSPRTDRGRSAGR